MSSPLKRLLNVTWELRSRLGFTAASNRYIRGLRQIAAAFAAQRGVGVGQKERNVGALEETYDVLIYGPLASGGLTTQVTQLIEVFERHGVSYRITHRVRPQIQHRARAFWVQRRAIGNPKIVISLERFPEVVVKNPTALKVFYLNLDWLRPLDMAASRCDADIVLYPIDYKFDFIRESYPNSKVLKLKWPAIGADRYVARQPLGPKDDIFVLYVGNELDDKSRKNPYAVVDAICRTTNPRLKFLLKFRSKIPAHYRAMLLKRDNVVSLHEEFVPADVVEKLYARAHINLIPNDSEGNGLSIIESIAKGVLPMVLDGYPMKDAVSADFGWLIPCRHVGVKGVGENYETDADSLLSVLDVIDHEAVNRRRLALELAQAEVAGRREAFETTILGILALRGVPRHAHYKKPRSPELLRKYVKPVDLIDVYLTTSRRPQFLLQTLPALLKACELSPYQHRITVLADQPDAETFAILARYSGEIGIMTTSSQMGLPFMWNLVHDHSQATAMRSERRPDYLCYLQDDCLINEPADYFRLMVDAHREVLEPGETGYISGFYCPIHPGFEKRSYKGHSVILSDSIDGKNFMAPPRLIYEVGKLSWYFPDGERRGNPGPKRGSHFDLWQWKESPTSLTSMQRVSIIIPGLCSHLAQEAQDSTWGNSTTAASQSKRVGIGKVYRTRPERPAVLIAPGDFYKGHMDDHVLPGEA